VPPFAGHGRRELDGGVSLRIVRGAVPVRRDLSVIELREVLRQIGMSREAVVAPVDLGDGKSDPLASRCRQAALPQPPKRQRKPSIEAGLLETRRKRFGTLPSCLLTASRNA
jgi:hypothetical protein